MKILINYQSGKTRKGSQIQKIKKILYEKYPNKDKISIHTLQLDHIIPFSISMDNSIESYQLLTPTQHKAKTIIDFKIIKEFRNKGWIEKVTNYSHELKVPIKFLVNEYKRLYSRLSQEKQVYPV